MLSSLPVNLIRNWCFCPRVVYYSELSDFPRLYPPWVRQGEQFHEKEAELWQRRNLSRFNLATGKIHLNYAAASILHGIHGITDMVIESDEDVYPVEFKLSSSYYKRGGILQLVAYGIILEETFSKNCPYGFLTTGKRITKIEIAPLVSDTLEKVAEIRSMLLKGRKPDSSATIHQCSRCEYLNHCNDRV